MQLEGSSEEEHCLGEETCFSVTSSSRMLSAADSPNLINMGPPERPESTTSPTTSYATVSTPPNKSCSPSNNNNDTSLTFPSLYPLHPLPVAPSDSLLLGLEQRIRMVPPELELRESGQHKGTGAWSRQCVALGTRYGPFVGRWTSEPIDRKYAWEVFIAYSGIHGYLDSTEFNTWLKYVRSSADEDSQNVKYVLYAGQIFYEITRDIGASEELLLPPKEVIQLDKFTESNSSPESRKDKDSVGQAASDSPDEDNDDEDEEDDSSFKCIVCDAVLPDIYQLDDHLVSSHCYQPDQYKCDFCNRSFCWRPNLLKHKALHGEYRKYPCENCTKVCTVFTDPSNLQRHIRSHHIGARSHACPECGKTFATSSGLKQHTHIHSSVKPFQCEVCFKAYTQFSNLCRHKRMHADCRMQIKCHKCGQAFSTVTSLSKHKRFCDTTPSVSSPSTPLPSTLEKLTNMSLPHHHNNHHSHPALGSPLMLYQKPPGFPFYPTSLLNHYPLFPGAAMAAGANPAAAAAFLNTSLLFANHNNKAESPIPSLFSSPVLSKREEHDRLREGMLHRSPHERKSVDRNRSPSRSIKEHISPRQILTSPPPAPSKSVMMTPTKTNDQPSPKADPKDYSILSSPASNHSSHRSNGKEEREESDQPLDLSVSKKNDKTKPIEIKRMEVAETKMEADVRKERRDEERMMRKRAQENDVPRERSEEKRSAFAYANKKEEHKHEPIPLPMTSQAPVLDTTKFPMFHPRPIHPMFLDAMYRLDRPPAPQFQPYGPPNPNPHLPPATPFNRFPFFNNALMSPQGMNGQATRTLEMMRNQLPPHFGKPFHDVLSPHVNKLRDRYSCKFCGKVFPRSANLTRHLRTHTGEQPYKCKYCERSFSISSNLQRHVRNIHNKEKPFKCPLCDRCFGQQTNLDRHLKKHETEEGNGMVADSPTSSTGGNDGGYFDEIRSFIGKVTDSNLSLTPPTINGTRPPTDVEDEDIEEFSDDVADANEISVDDDIDHNLSPKENGHVTYDLKFETKEDKVSPLSSSHSSVVNNYDEIEISS